jgi:hypothetical protein
MKRLGVEDAVYITQPATHEWFWRSTALKWKYWHEFALILFEYSAGSPSIGHLFGACSVAHPEAPIKKSRIAKRLNLRVIRCRKVIYCKVDLCSIKPVRDSEG